MHMTSMQHTQVNIVTRFDTKDFYRGTKCAKYCRTSSPRHSFVSAVVVAVPMSAFASRFASVPLLSRLRVCMVVASSNGAGVRWTATPPPTLACTTMALAMPPHAPLDSAGHASLPRPPRAQPSSAIVGRPPPASRCHHRCSQHLVLLPQWTTSRLEASMLPAACFCRCSP